MKRAIIVSLTTLLFLFAAQSAGAQQYGPYQGPPPAVSILVDKQISRPFETKGGAVEREWVDNLGADDHRFKPGNPVFFRVIVKNTSDSTLTGITLKDFIPDFMDPFEGHGTFDANTRVITISAGDFAAREEKTFTVNMKVLPADQLPADKSVVCVVNRAEASNDKVSDDDSSQFCIEKEVTRVREEIKAEEVPAAGAQNNLIIAAVASGLGLLGIKLRNTEGKRLKRRQ